jgi:hypothetical protein
LIGRTRRLSVTNARRLIGSLVRGLIRRLIRSLIRSLAGILARPLILRLICILRRAVRRGNLAILNVGRRSRRSPLTLLSGRRCLLCGLLCRRNQGRSQRQARTERPGKYPLQTIAVYEIHPKTPLPRRNARSFHPDILHRREFTHTVTVTNPVLRQKLSRRSPASHIFRSR